MWYKCYAVTLGVTLREADDKDDVDDHEAKQISAYHFVDHHHKWSNFAEAPENSKQTHYTPTAQKAGKFYRSIAHDKLADMSWVRRET